MFTRMFINIFFVKVKFKTLKTTTLYELKISQSVERVTLLRHHHHSFLSAPTTRGMHSSLMDRYMGTKQTIHSDVLCLHRNVLWKKRVRMNNECKNNHVNAIFGTRTTSILMDKQSAHHHLRITPQLCVTDKLMSTPVGLSET